MCPRSSVYSGSLSLTPIPLKFAEIHVNAALLTQFNIISALKCSQLYFADKFSIGAPLKGLIVHYFCHRSIIYFRIHIKNHHF